MFPTPVRFVKSLIAGSAAASPLKLAVEVPALRVVQRHRADERELQAGHLLAREPVRLDHAERVLPGVEARDLRDERRVEPDADPVEHLARGHARERQVLRAERVDRRRDDGHVLDRQVGRDEVREREDGRVVVARGSRAGTPRSPGWARSSRCGSARPSARRPCRRAAASPRAAGRGRRRSRSRPRAARRCAPRWRGRRRAPPR